MVNIAISLHYIINCIAHHQHIPWNKHNYKTCKSSLQSRGKQKEQHPHQCSTPTTSQPIRDQPISTTSQYAHTWVNKRTNKTPVSHSAWWWSRYWKKTLPDSTQILDSFKEHLMLEKELISQSSFNSAEAELCWNSRGIQPHLLQRRTTSWLYQHIQDVMQISANNESGQRRCN